MAKRPRLHLLHLQGHARRAGRAGAERVPGAAAPGGAAPPPPAGGGAALGSHRGGVDPRCGDVPGRGVSQPDDGGDPGGEVRPGAPETRPARPAAAQLGETGSEKLNK